MSGDDFDPTDPHKHLSDPDFGIAQLQRGFRLFEQLQNVDSASAAFRAVYGENADGGALSPGDLRAIAMVRCSASARGPTTPTPTPVGARPER